MAKNHRTINMDAGSYGEGFHQRLRFKKMKRIGNLFHSICTLDNLGLADKKARMGKSGQYGVQLHEANQEANLLVLRDNLLAKTYATSSYTTFKIYEPKEREIFRLPYYPDRITHHAVMNVLQPIFMATFTGDTYSCIKGKGIHAAVRNLKAALKDKKGTQYCLKLDIKKFYPSIDHDILKAQLERKFKDKDLLWLLGNIIDSAPGVPIGNYLSQYFANFYLAYFDHWLKEDRKIKYYFRYADDLVILSDNKPQLHQLLADIRTYLSRELKLEIKSNYQVFPVEARGIDFVGYVFFHGYTLLRKSIKQNFARMLANRPNDESTAAYWGWCKHCDSRHLLKKLLTMETINKFSDFGIKPQTKGFAGDKIEIKRLFNKQIEVLDYKIEKSKFEDKGNGKRLTLSIKYEGEERITWTGSLTLQELIESVPKDNFPFTTTIIKEGERYRFT